MKGFPGRASNTSRLVCQIRWVRKASSLVGHERQLSAVLIGGSRCDEVGAHRIAATGGVLIKRAKVNKKTNKAKSL